MTFCGVESPVDKKEMLNEKSQYYGLGFLCVPYVGYVFVIWDLCIYDIIHIFIICDLCIYDIIHIFINATARSMSYDVTNLVVFYMH